MFGLFYPLATIVVVYLINRYLQFELKQTPSLTKHLRWVVGALILQIAAVLVNSLHRSHIGNFIQHSLGGGATMTLLFVYFIKTFQVQLNLRMLTIILVGFVCTFGVINELAEFAGALIGIGVFSFDSHDTWRDLFANTVGMALAWLIVLVVYRFNKRSVVT